MEFVGEEGFDTGGLTREFFTIINKDMHKKYMDCGTFMHNAVALQVFIYIFPCMKVCMK